MQQLNSKHTQFLVSLTLIAYVQNYAPKNFSSFLRRFNSLSIVWAGSVLLEWITPLGKGHCHPCCSYSSLVTAVSVTIWESQDHFLPLPEIFQTHIPCNPGKYPNPPLHLTESWEFNGACATANQSTKETSLLCLFFRVFPRVGGGLRWDLSSKDCLVLPLRTGSCETHKQSVEDRQEPGSLLVSRECSNRMIMLTGKLFPRFSCLCAQNSRHHGECPWGARCFIRAGTNLWRIEMTPVLLHHR